MRMDEKLVPQKHGGALKQGNPGNKGGGRPRSVIRGRLSGVLEEHGVGVLEEILTAPREVTVTCDECGHTQEVKPPSSDADRLRGVDVAAKYSVGIVKEVSVEEVVDRVQATAAAIQELMGEEAATMLPRLKEIWNG